VTGLGALSRFARRGRAAPTGEELCALCSAPVAPAHPHVVDLTARTVECACRACALLFAHPGAGARFRTVPTRVLEDPRHAVAEADWAALEIPVRLAFLFRSSAAGRWLAVYPSPVGATESALPLDAWARVSAGWRLAALAEPDVEALLVRGEAHAGQGRGGGGQGPLRCMLVPIDRCYELVGRIRRTWRGFDGGDEVRREIDGFFAELSRRSRPPEGDACSSAPGA
jgi:uncharacterized protein DUF5947